MSKMLGKSAWWKGWKLPTDRAEQRNAKRAQRTRERAEVDAELILLMDETE